GLFVLWLGTYERPPLTVETKDEEAVWALSTTWSALSEPWNLAFVCVAYANLTALFVVIRRSQRRLTPASPAKERRRLRRQAWELSTALSCAFAYRAERIMPPAMAVIVWTMTACAIVGGLYILVLNDDGRGSEDCHAVDVDDGQSSLNKLTAHEMV
ncbi:uncharacterized protein LOC121054412, partial [Oryza brachyantha]|uniref:uncharacterized protein LOC121054412 n=1 Tax=Oryza brachyantha TaxID=4533 RepID=UPI001ADC8E9D